MKICPPAAGCVAAGQHNAGRLPLHLAGFYLAYRTSESTRTSVAANVPDAPVLSWLKEDMGLHGIKPLEVEHVHYPAITNSSQLLGFLYVKQGSTLGGRVISKHLSRTLGLVDEKPTIFLPAMAMKRARAGRHSYSSLKKAM